MNKRAKKDITICFLYSKKVFLAKPNITNALNEKKNTVNKTIDHIKLFKDKPVKSILSKVSIRIQLIQAE